MVVGYYCVSVSWAAMEIEFVGEIYKERKVRESKQAVNKIGTSPELFDIFKNYNISATEIRS
jgi:hypothetical protein